MRRFILWQWKINFIWYKFLLLLENVLSQFFGTNFESRFHYSIEAGMKLFLNYTLEMLEKQNITSLKMFTLPVIHQMQFNKGIPRYSSEFVPLLCCFNHWHTIKVLPFLSQRTIALFLELVFLHKHLQFVLQYPGSIRLPRLSVPILDNAANNKIEQ